MIFKTSHVKISLFVGAVFWLCLASAGFAQDAVPGEILQRTFLIKVGNEGGTAFAIDHKGSLYLITARHVVAALPTGKTTLEVWHSDKWEPLQIVKTVFPASPDVDIAVLETGEPAKEPYKVVTVMGGTDGPTFGQQIWFLGYPFGDAGLMSRFAGNAEIRLPFIKRGTMSAMDSSKPDAVVLYIDGFNNPGFSGGPIIFWDFNKREYKILGVVKGYRNDTAKIDVNGQQLPSNILINSGILVGYSIKHAIEAIENDHKP